MIGALGLLRGVGCGRFAPFAAFGPPLARGSILATGDFNEDGRPDIIGVPHGSHVNVYLNIGCDVRGADAGPADAGSRTDAGAGG
jgi:hypothetical protein